MTSFELAGIPTFSVTPYGIHAHLKVMDISPSLSIGLISCVIDIQGREDIVGLFLSPCTSAMDPRRPLFHVGALDFHLLSHRTVLLGDTRNSVHIYHDSPLLSFPRWREIYIAHRPPPTTHLIPHIPSSCTTSPPFRIPLPDIMKGLPDWTLFTMTLSGPSWAGKPPIVLTFKHVNGSYLVVILGICRRQDSEDHDQRSRNGPSHQGSSRHWARVFTPNERLSEVPSHDCMRDHIRNWPRQSKTVPTPVQAFAGFLSGPIPNRPTTLTVSFSPCPISPGDTLVLNMKYCRFDFQLY